VGGYDDWEAQRPRAASTDAQAARAGRQSSPGRTDAPGAPKAQAAGAPAPSEAADKPRKNRLAPWEAEELAGLPDRIAALEAEQAALAARLSDPDLYSQGPDEAQRVQQALAELEGQLEALFERWTLLEDKRGE
jgi:ATP-binding cassette subfamily F protein uup